MACYHLVRVGAMGNVGRFGAVDAVRYDRGMRVIVRTSRGLEAGEVLSAVEQNLERGTSDGSILRGMTVEDQLLEARLEKKRQEAFAACTTRLTEMGQDAMLVDVEHLFDGQSLFFYFLGESTPDLERVTQELAEVYDATAQFRKFTQTMTEGCGPGCGTEEGAGQGCTTCATGCSISGACGTRKIGHG